MSDITWCGFVIPGDDEEESWSTEYAAGYLGVTYAAEDSPAWSAVIECGQLMGEGAGETSTAALESARAALRSLLDEHTVLLREHFKEP